MERALKNWKTGRDETGGDVDNDEDGAGKKKKKSAGFVDHPWGEVSAIYYTSTAKLSAIKWERIQKRTMELLPAKASDKLIQEVEVEEEMDVRKGIQVSDGE